MNPVLEAAIRYVNALGGPRKTEVDTLRELKKRVDDYTDAHQGVSDSLSNLSTSSCSMRSASASQ